ncbi:MAG: HlyC/CorC family transporter [Pseudonocardiales bacterium]|nr:HlyC/CorC family transporter [Pseudonocardiales bacterium]
MSSDVLVLLAAVLLLLINAFFVGAEFSLISARRDRLEAMAYAGTAGASTALRAGADLSRMLAAAQLGITICSLLLGRLGEPAVAHVIEAPFLWAGLPPEILEPVAFAISLAVVVAAHMVIGEMVPKNIALAGPERTAIWLVPPFLVFTTAMRPVIALFDLAANGVLRLLHIEPRDELETAFTSGELADLIAESGREGLLDDDGSRRLTRTLSSAGHSVADVLVPSDELISLPQRLVVDDVARAVADTGFSRFPVRAATGFSGYLHVKDILDIADDPSAAVPPERVRRLPQVRVTDRIDVALAVLRRAGAHLGRAVDEAGATEGLVTLEDLIEHYVGTVRDATPAREDRV